eukprot:7255353-Prymnesium_polylepis.2
MAHWRLAAGAVSAAVVIAAARGSALANVQMADHTRVQYSYRHCATQLPGSAWGSLILQQRQGARGATAILYYGAWTMLRWRGCDVLGPCAT